MKKIGVLVSGNGSNLQALIDAREAGKLNAEIAVVVSNNAEAFALDRASKAKIKSYAVSKTQRDTEILNILTNYDVDVVVLAGYLKKVGKNILDKYEGKIINIHPSLLPKFGGAGMYGIHVHRAVIEAGEKRTGATVHLVTEDYDQGAILDQVELEVAPEDTAESLATKVLEVEHSLLVEALNKFLLGL